MTILWRFVRTLEYSNIHFTALIIYFMPFFLRLKFTNELPTSSNFNSKPHQNSITFHFQEKNSIGGLLIWIVIAIKIWQVIYGRSNPLWFNNLVWTPHFDRSNAFPTWWRARFLLFEKLIFIDYLKMTWSRHLFLFYF